MVLEQKFFFLCLKGFSGYQCEIADKKFILSFDKNLVVSQSIFIHLIEVIEGVAPVRLTTFRTIPLRQDSVTIRWSRPYHLVFIEFSKKHYYLAVTQTTSNPSTIIHKTIYPSDRCPYIREVLNENIVQWHFIRRIKYYHFLCQLLNLSCFYDDVHLCLCYDFEQQRLSNCFNFNHKMTFDCQVQSECESNAQCLEDHAECLTRSICMCQPCFYGRRCQFNTNGFGLSLDIILGYHILANVNLNHQPYIINSYSINNDHVWIEISSSSSYRNDNHIFKIISIISMSFD
jgi:hypothetical protein